MDEYMTFEDAENKALDDEMVRLVTRGVINPQPVFDIIAIDRVFGGERVTQDQIDNLTGKALELHLETPAYARRVEEQL